MAERTLKALTSAGAAEILVANRTWERAEALAQKCGGRAIPLDQVGATLAAVDVLVTTTGAQETILENGAVDATLASRQGEPLLIVDVAVPRDVDPAAAELPGVTLLDMDDLGSFVDIGLAGRAAEVGKVRAIVDSEVDRYRAMVSAREVAPLIGGLRGAADEIRSSELERFASRLSGLDADQRQAVEALTKGIVNKLLHQPTVRLKDAAGHARGDRLAEALRDLFDL
jgi:glutamyl-tRNA reductase